MSDCPAPRAGALALLACVALAGCAVGPRALQEARLQYNEVVKTTSEQQLLLNIVRLRYTDTPSSLSIANIAAQFELVKSLQLVPFFTASGAVINESFRSVLPSAGIAAADRPTLSLVPIDDEEFTRRLFTPLSLDGVIYLAKTTWPIATVFRLYLENLNWVPNAEFASGPTPRLAPEYADFLRGILALQELQQRGYLIIGAEEREESLGGPIPHGQVTAANVIEAAKNGFELRPDPGGRTWQAVRKVRKPFLYIHPRAAASPEAREFERAFKLKPGEPKYQITTDHVRPFGARGDAQDFVVLDLEPRSLLQALYFVSHGVDIPPEHAAARITATTYDADGKPFDWKLVTAGLFRVLWSESETPPPDAHVAIRYQNRWFYIDIADHETKATFSLLMELARLELQPRKGDRPLLTLPLGQ
jgi:hypothetical protein